MHADQATEPLVDWALALNKPFAVLPCCVFPNLFPARLAPQVGVMMLKAVLCSYASDRFLACHRLQRELDQVRRDVLEGLSADSSQVDQDALARAIAKLEQQLATASDKRGQVRTHAQFVRYLQVSLLPLPI